MILRNRPENPADWMFLIVAVQIFLFFSDETSVRRRPNLKISNHLAPKPGRSEIKAGANWRLGWWLENIEEGPRACYSKLVIGAEDCLEVAAAELANFY
jgi:hypothetical protein